MATASATATQALSSTDEKDSYQRLSRLIMRAGTEVLRALFDSFYPPNSLANKLSESATKKDLRKALLKPQRMLVYPAQGLFGKSKDFDISLLTQLLKTLCQTKLPTLHSGWDCLPSTSNLTLTADIVRIKLYRNYVIHKYYYGELNDEEFFFLWDEIKKALLRIASYISAETKLEWEEAINRLRHDPLTSEAARDAEELMEMYQKDMIIKECIVSGFARVERLIQDSSEETNERLDEIKDEIGRLCELVTDRAQSSSAVEGGGQFKEEIVLLKEVQ